MAQNDPPIQTVRRALNRFTQNSQQAKSVINEALTMIEVNSEINTLVEAIEAFNFIVHSLIEEHPNSGYELWKPPSTPNADDGGTSWKKAKEELERYWTNHTASGL
jgi:hypothetical protein